MRLPLYLEDCGVVTSIGIGKSETVAALLAGNTGITLRDDLASDRGIYVGAVQGELPPLDKRFVSLDCRNNRLMQIALLEIAPAVAGAAARYGKDRIAVILGTSTSGIESGEMAYLNYIQTGQWPEVYHYQQQELSGLSQFAAKFLGLSGPAYTVATACSSSAKVFASARRLIEAGIVDAAVVGGADTLCKMTLRGFSSLEIMSSKRCNPFSINRNGITIGEGAAAFLLTREKGPVMLLGVGETSDAYHMTAPDPEGNGARNAMIQALTDAHLAPSDICYINLHGTATPFNDAMESRAVSSVFGPGMVCSSTKGMTGHMLGAAGACEAAFVWLTLNAEISSGYLPTHLWDNQIDTSLASLGFVKPMTPLPQNKPIAMMSNSFGFGGSNASLVFARTGI